MPKVSFRMASAYREWVFGVQTNTARKIHRSDHTEGRSLMPLPSNAIRASFSELYLQDIAGPKMAASLLTRQPAKSFVLSSRTTRRVPIRSERSLSGSTLVG